MISVFTYGFKTATDILKRRNARCIPSVIMICLIEKALDSKYISDKDLKTLKAWRESPESWGSS